MRILVVEDDIDACEMLQILVEREGHEVVTARDGRAGWEKFNHGHFSVLISDWLMPDINGLDLCRRVRAADKPHYCYVILLTALSGKAKYLEAMHAGVDDFITK